MERLAALPGVESVGLVNSLPLDEGARPVQVTSDAAAGEDAPQPMVNLTMVGGDYFQTMGIDLLSGRYLERSDEVPAEVEAVVSRGTADLLWPDEEPLDRHLGVVMGPEPVWVRVVGVVEDIMLRDFRQESTMLTVAIAAGLALVLGAIGLFGVLSYVVSQRTREIGIRMALGARAGELRRMVVAQGGRVALVGVVIGLLVAAALSRVLESMLFGVEARHLPTFVAMSLLMLGVAGLASYLPARRASGVDPVTSLRTE